MVEAEPQAGTVADPRRPRLLVLSTSLLVDRMLQHTAVLPTLARQADVTMWRAGDVAPEAQTRALARAEPFPAVRPFREFPYNYLRRLNEFAWDAALRLPSRESIYRHTRRYPAIIRGLRPVGRALAAAGLNEPFEHLVERLLLSYPRSAEAEARLRRLQPSFMLTTGPFQYEQPAVVSAARTLGIPTVAMIPSWDNLSTKNRMVFRYDGYIVWSSWMRDELHAYYPHSRTVPVYVVGAPQFDVFFQDRFHVSRETFCQRQGLRPERPIVLYALGSPNLFREHHGALDLARRIAAGDLGDVQMIVRPHPMFDKAELLDAFSGFGPGVIVQRTADADAPLTARAQDAARITDWVNSFRHADVVVNLSSTVAIDAAVLDRPVVNLDYDPEPGAPNQALVRDVNHAWTHFRPIAESGGVWLTNDGAETAAAVRTYLRHPERHRQERRWMAARVCEHLDGRCGERLAAALLDFEARTSGRSVTDGAGPGAA